MINIADVKSFVLGSLNATANETGYYIFGMSVDENTINVAVEMARRNLHEIVGQSAYINDKNSMKFESYIVDMACMRTLIALLGISIPVHFNYKTTDLSISKNVYPPIEEMISQYTKSIEKWMRIIMSGEWTGVQNQDDLSFSDPIYCENLGHDYIGRDIDAIYNLRGGRH